MKAETVAALQDARTKRRAVVLATRLSDAAETLVYPDKADGVLASDPALLSAARGARATGSRFPGVKVMQEWADDAFETMGLDVSTAVVTLTHDPKLDDPALEAALKSDAFYVGALGSKRTHAKRKERLAEAGITDEQFSRINGPVGLNIG